MQLHPHFQTYIFIEIVNHPVTKIHFTYPTPPQPLTVTWYGIITPTCLLPVYRCDEAILVRVLHSLTFPVVFGSNPSFPFKAQWYSPVSWPSGVGFRRSIRRSLGRAELGSWAPSAGLLAEWSWVPEPHPPVSWPSGVGFRHFFCRSLPRTPTVEFGSGASFAGLLAQLYLVRDLHLPVSRPSEILVPVLSSLLSWRNDAWFETFICRSLGRVVLRSSISILAEWGLFPVLQSLVSWPSTSIRGLLAECCFTIALQSLLSWPSGVSF